MSYLNKILHPAYFQAPGNAESYFEGWYFKHECKDIVFALIPGISLSKSDPHAFIQLILKLGKSHETHYFRYPLSAFFADRGALAIKIGENEFSARGVTADFSARGIDFSCAVSYGGMTPVKKTVFCPTIMGFFSYVPNMECNHEVISLSHKISGEIFCNGEKFYMENGIGYMEKDWGRSFPSEYFWVQCNNFETEGSSFMLSAAVIPFMKSSFFGFICVFRASGKQYLFSTYNFASLEILSQSRDSIELVLKKRNYKLILSARTLESGTLAAPDGGNMNRIIKESVMSEITLLLEKGGQIIFSSKGINAGFEMVGKDHNKPLNR